MDRRRFLEIASRLGASFGGSIPFLGPSSLGALAATSAALRSFSGQGLVLPLDKGWQVAVDPGNIGRSQDWFHSPRPDAQPTAVPSIIQQVFPGYHGVAWYWIDFVPQPNPMHGGRSLLRFHAVDYLADVWLNGQHMGSHEGGETPFALDVTETIRTERNNMLAVRVLNPGDERIDGIVLAETPHRNKVVKFMNGSLYDYGGIIEPVELLFAPAIRVSDVFVNPDWRTGRLTIQTALTNVSGKQRPGRLKFVVTERTSGLTVLVDEVSLAIPNGDKQVTHQLLIQNRKEWSLDTPFLYQLAVEVEAEAVDGHHQLAAAFGFRDFRLINGYFRLNDKRIFLKCTHTGNHCPFGQVNPPEGYPDLLRRDLLNAKASGFNTVRFISGLAHPYQLDLCDQLGLLIYEEPSASWLLKDSPRMKQLYEASIREMILRDRNHPSVAIWGVLNETEDGPVFQEAVSALPLVRSLDESRLVLLSSGRFDGHLEIGSASNPDTSQWQYVWGKETPGAGRVALAAPSGPGSGDFHFYPLVPQTPEANQAMRTLGQGGKPVFLSEYGIGSMMNVIHETQMYEQAGIPRQAEDFVLMESMANRFSSDWKRFGMDSVYPFPELLLQMSQKKMARHRLLGFNLIRSNPMICGFNLTGMLDHALTGEGLWRFWRGWKPEVFDALQNGWAPVRWCLFVEPTHTYLGRPITLEAVLANEDVLRPGDYPAELCVWGPTGSAWNKEALISMPETKAGEGPLALPVMKEQVLIQGIAGSYEFMASTPHGIAPPEASWQFYLSDEKALPRPKHSIVTWQIPRNVELWLNSRGVTTTPMQHSPSGDREILVVGNLSGSRAEASQWRMLAERLANGSTVIFLSPQSFEREGNGAFWLPLANKGRVVKFTDLLYHKECVAKTHPVFEGIQGNGILDWYYFGPVLPTYLFDGQDAANEVIAAAFATGYPTPGGYASGVLIGQYEFGAGHFILNSFPILENVDKHPVADRLLLNLVTYSAALPADRVPPPPSELKLLVTKIGYVT